MPLYIGLPKMAKNLLTDRQFAVIGALLGSERPGKDVRQELLTTAKIKQSLASFYLMMQRLEEAKLIRGRYKPKEVAGVKFRERWYEVTAGGRRAWKATREFYRSQGEMREAWA